MKALGLVILMTCWQMIQEVYGTGIRGKKRSSPETQSLAGVATEKVARDFLHKLRLEDCSPL